MTTTGSHISRSCSRSTGAWDEWFAANGPSPRGVYSLPSSEQPHALAHWRRTVCDSCTAATTRILGGRHAHPRARHRGKRRDLQRGTRDPSQAPALPRARAARVVRPRPLHLERRAALPARAFTHARGSSRDQPRLGHGAHWCGRSDAAQHRTRIAESPRRARRPTHDRANLRGRRIDAWAGDGRNPLARVLGGALRQRPIDHRPANHARRHALQCGRRPALGLRRARPPRRALDPARARSRRLVPSRRRVLADRTSQARHDDPAGTGRADLVLPGDARGVRVCAGLL